MNDVAGVNIDAKLIRNNKNKDRDPTKNTTKDLADTIELANGCACEPCPAKPQISFANLCCLLRLWPRLKQVWLQNVLRWQDSALLHVHLLWPSAVLACFTFASPNKALCWELRCRHAPHFKDVTRSMCML